MWTLAGAAAATGAAGDNFWSFLGVVAVALLGSGGVLAVRRRKSVEHTAPRHVAEAITNDLTPYLRQQVMDLKHEVDELRQSHDAQVQTIADLKAENQTLRLGGRKRD